MISLDHNDQPVDVSWERRQNGGGQLTLEVTRQCQRKRNTIAIDLALNAFPCSHQHYSLGRIASGSLQNTVQILAGVI